MGGLSALQPLFLIGALGALAPLVIHLIERRRLQRVTFGSVWFLRGLVKKLARRRRTSELVLLALRMAVVGFLAMAFSRPFFGPDAAGKNSALASGRAEAILVDASASMEFGTRMADARKSALAAIDRLRPGDFVAVYSFGPGLVTVMPWTADHAAARAAVTQLSASEQGSDLSAALRQVNDAIAERLEGDREITVCSDMQASSWEDYHGEWRLRPGVALALTDVGGTQTPSNVGIVRLGVPSKAVAGSEPEVLTAQVRNYSDKPREITVDLVLQGKKVNTRQTTLPPNSSSSVSFRHEFALPEGTQSPVDVEGQFVLGVQDDFPADNHASFVVHVSPKIKVVLVNGSSDPTPKSNDGYFLKRALVPWQESIFEVEEVTPQAFAGAKLEGVGAVVLADVATLSDDSVSRLKAWVNHGGGVMFFAGTQTTPVSFNRLFTGLAPCRLDEMVDVVPVGEHREGVVIGEVDLQNPIFQPFSKPYYGDFTHAHFRRYFGVTDSQAAQVLARFDDRRPAVLLKKIGRGMSLLVVSSADLEMNDFCLRGVFLPFVHQAIRLLAAYGDTNTLTSETGTEMSVELPAGVTSAKLTAPGGSIRTITPVKKEERSAETAGPATPLSRQPTVVNFTAAEQGIYRLNVGGAEGLFAANIDPREGDLAKLVPDEVAAALTRRRGATEAGEDTVRVETAKLRDEDIEKSQGIGWILLLLTAGLLVAEMALADRITARD